MEIRQEIKRRAADIEARIAPFLPQEKGFQQTVLDAMEYSVFAGGKRLRPMLMEASYQMFDGTNPAIDDFMAAIEMIHTYSLIHDDLLMIGAILAGADEVSVARMQEAGEKLGLAFQIQDDILDVTGSFEKLGKPIGSDAENEKATYVTFEGLEQAKKDVERLSGEAIKILDEFEGEHTFLHDLFFYLINRDH